jgi:ribonucrease Y
VSVELVLIIVLGIAAGGASLAAFKQNALVKSFSKAEKDASRIVSDAEQKAKSLVQRAERDAEEQKRRVRSQVESELGQKRKSVDDSEKRARDKERYLDERDAVLVQREQEIQQRILSVKELREKQEEILAELFAHLEKVSTMTREEAEKVMMANVLAV